MRLMLCGLPGSLPIVTAMLALSDDPPPVGVNFTAIVQLECAGTVAVHVPLVRAKSPAFAPLRLSLNASENPDRFVTVTIFVLVGTFAVSVPNASVTGATVAGIVGPVLRATA